MDSSLEFGNRSKMMRVTGKSIRPEQKTGSLSRRFQNSGRPNSRIEAKINSADLQSGRY
jgi:hypothetical protein